MRNVFFILAMLVLGFFQGCTSSTPDNFSTEISAKPQSPISDNVMAIVNNESITRDDLDFAIKRLVDESKMSELSKAAKKKILESTILTLLMAKAEKAMLTEKEIAKLEQDVSAYRQQLLTRKYIIRNATPEPVTQQMVADYYYKYPLRFGGRTIRTYEMISGISKLPEDKRDNLLITLNKIKKNDNWKKTSTQLGIEKYALVYSSAEADETILHPQLRALMKPMKINEVSATIFIEGKPYLVRIVSDSIIEPKPLSSVSLQIRKSLVPIQLRKSVKLLSEKLMQQANIRYFTSAN